MVFAGFTSCSITHPLLSPTAVYSLLCEALNVSSPRRLDASSRSLRQFSWLYMTLWTFHYRFIALSRRLSYLASSASFANQTSFPQVTRSSLPTNTFHALPSILPHFTLIVSVRWSKVLQFRERTLLIPLVSIQTHPLCPVQALREFFNMCQHRLLVLPLLFLRLLVFVSSPTAHSPSI